MTISASPGGDDAEEQVRGRHAYRQFVSDQGGRGSLDRGILGSKTLEAKHRSHSQSDINGSGSRPSLSRSSLPIPPRRQSTDWMSLYTSRSPSLHGDSPATVLSLFHL